MTQSKLSKTGTLAFLLTALLLVPELGHCFYNPSAGRWLSRDPIGEQGGNNLHGFCSGDAVNAFDIVGLYLEFWSQGKVYFDGPRPWTGRTTREYSESGINKSSSAYFYQSVVEIKNCHNGICNSGGTGKQSSFVFAKVKNVARCPVTVDCQCSIHWFVSNYTPGRQGRKGSIVSGIVLDHSFTKFYGSKLQPDGSYLASGSGDFPQHKTFRLAGGASKDLYHGQDVNNTSAPDMPGAGFTESMSGDCACSIIND